VKLQTTAFDIAQRFQGIKEVAGSLDNPQIMAMLRLDGAWPASDEVPWCSAFVNYVAWLLNLPRSYSLAARSWLQIGRAIDYEDAEQENDVVVISRGLDPTKGHVGFYAGLGTFNHVRILGGNQNNSVSVSEFDAARIIGVRRLA
jgi:uncharacterized protein (TIGR02594 family)